MGGGGDYLGGVRSESSIDLRVKVVERPAHCVQVFSGDLTLGEQQVLSDEAVNDERDPVAAAALTVTDPCRIVERITTWT